MCKAFAASDCSVVFCMVMYKAGVIGMAKNF